MDNAYRISDKRQEIILPYNEAVSNIIQHRRLLEYNGRKYCIVPHRHTETKLLNNLGINIPPPILHQYDWCNSKPFDSQKDTAAMLTKNFRAYVLNDMGTGKTRAALYAADFLMNTGDIENVLVIAPLSTLTTVWEHEIFACFPHRTSVALHGSREKRLQLLAEPFDFYIINHDGLKVVEDAIQSREDINLIIVDELAVLRNAKTSRWKAINRIVKNRKYAWGMTGAPTPNGPADAYGQTKLLTPDRVPKYFTAFKEATMYRITQFKWLPRKEANNIVRKAMQPSVRYKRSDCIDLPPTTYSTREAALSPMQKTAYRDMLQKCRVEFAEGRITAANAGVQASKLIQIAAGFTYGENGMVVDLPHTPRLELLKELIEQTERKVIVFTPFRHSVEQLHKELSKTLSTAVIYGGISKTKRDEIFTLFQNAANPRIIVAHPATMSHGLNLTAADTIIWYAPMYSLETYEQANARIPRPGQTCNTSIIHIECTPIERRIYKTLQRRGDIQAELLGMFRADTQESLYDRST